MSSIPLFLASLIPLMLSPGPAKLFLIGISAGKGFRYGLMIAVGIYISDILHVSLSALGVGKILQENPALFDMIRAIGAVYLAWLAIKSFRKIFNAQGLSVKVADRESDESMASFLTSGLLINLFNPLALVFYISFLPQFINEHSRLGYAEQILIYGLPMVSVFFVFHLILSYFCGFASSILASNGRQWVRAQSAVVGVIFLFLAARVLFQMSLFA